MVISKSEQWLQKFAYENPDMVLGYGVKFARQAAIVNIFYRSGWRWVDGVPQHGEGEVGAGRGRKGLSRSSWRDPLRLRGEDTLDGFINNNLAAKTFIEALSQTLVMAKRPAIEADEIVRRAAEKIYPDYAERSRLIAKMASDSIVMECYINDNLQVPADGSLLANLPAQFGEGWWELTIEALMLPKCLIDKFEQKVGPDVRNTKKWTDKMIKSLKKKGCNSKNEC